MAETISLYVNDEPEAPERNVLRQIGWLSRPFELLFGAATIIIVTAYAAMIALGLFTESGLLMVNSQGTYLVLGEASAVPADAVYVSSLPLITRLTGTLAVLIIFGSLAAALWSLRHLFAGYRRGEVFTMESSRRMMRSGLWLIAFGLAPGLAQPLVRAAGAIDENWFYRESLAVIIIGLALLLHSRVTSLGVMLERERKGYV